MVRNFLPSFGGLFKLGRSNNRHFHTGGILSHRSRDMVSCGSCICYFAVPVLSTFALLFHGECCSKKHGCSFEYKYLEISKDKAFTCTFSSAPLCPLLDKTTNILDVFTALWRHMEKIKPVPLNRAANSTRVGHWKDRRSTPSEQDRHTFWGPSGISATDLNPALRHRRSRGTSAEYSNDLFTAIIPELIAVFFNSW